MKNDISIYLNKFDLDIRKSKYSRFMDQKVTPDVLSFIADCILNLTSGDESKTFTRKDIENSSYFINNVTAIYDKPSPENPNTSNEYDKFIGQPLRVLNYANILDSEKVGLSYIYKIKNFQILQFVAVKERNALNFLYEYITKVLRDSGLLIYFDEFKKSYEHGSLTNDDLRVLRSKYEQFIHGHTDIKRDLEIRRIFPKVLNVYSNINNIQGTDSGVLSKYPYSYSDLMYNTVNFRDINKMKSLTRQEVTDQKQKQTLEQQISQHERYDSYRISRAIKFIKDKYKESEVKDKFFGIADHVHHIFSKSSFPEIATYLENLIKLTTYQHLTLAHPHSNTKIINKEYQLTCLIAKSISIEESLAKNEFFYSKESFIHVINVGLSKDLNMNLSFKEIQTKLSQIYNDN
jgi:hypothetical protein